MAGRVRLALVRRARKVYRELGGVYPYAKRELDFEIPFQLFIAVILSAQATDIGVNKVSPALFAKMTSTTTTGTRSRLVTGIC